MILLSDEGSLHDLSPLQADVLVSINPSLFTSASNPNLQLSLSNTGLTGRNNLGNTQERPNLSYSFDFIADIGDVTLVILFNKGVNLRLTLPKGIKVLEHDLPL